MTQRRISPVATGDRRFAAGSRKTFEKVLSKLSKRLRHDSDKKADRVAVCFLCCFKIKPGL